MQKFTLTLIAGSALALAACGSNTATNSASANASGNGSADAAAMGSNGAAGATAAAAWTETSRIVVEDGVTYRVDANGPRVRLGPNDSRIVVESGVRYRVDPDGARVRIDQQGVRVGDSVIKGNAPNGRSDVETPGEAMTDAGEDAVEAVGDIVPD